jgi:glycerol-3-phosphate cytidylyltransferase
MKVVYTGGTFDLFHAGHVQFLEKCRNLAGETGQVIVSLNPDTFIQKFKNKPPVIPFMERYEILRACVYVDRVIANISGEDSRPTIEAINPELIVIGDDWLEKDYHKQMGFTEEWLEEKKIELIYVPYTKNVSTTIIKDRVKKWLSA